MTRGLILLAHGARDARWSQPFEEIARRVALAPAAPPLRLAYLDFMAPDVEGAAAELVAAGCDTIAVQPMFLGTGGHVRQDLPRLVAALRARWPELDFVLLAAIGEIAAVQQAMAEAALHGAFAAAG